MSGCIAQVDSKISGVKAYEPLSTMLEYFRLFVVAAWLAALNLLEAAVWERGAFWEGTGHVICTSRSVGRSELGRLKAVRSGLFLESGSCGICVT